MAKEIIDVLDRNPYINWRERADNQFGPSLTIPGQSLIPSELMKRHLSGTAGDIDLSSMYEYHFNEEGEQIGEPMPVDLYEFHALALKVKNDQIEAGEIQRQIDAENLKQQIIAEYEKLRSGQEKIKLIETPQSNSLDT